MNILLTGATGYLGSHLAQAFVAAGDSVTVLKRSSSDMCRLAAIQSSLVVYDLDGDGLAAAFNDKRFDAVVHTATCYGRRGESPREVFDVNTAWPLRLLEIATVMETPVFINTDTSLDRFLNPYALSKKQFREWGCYFADQQRIHFVNVVLEHFYGPGDDGAKFVTQVIHRCLGNEAELQLTVGTQQRDFIHIDDVIAAYLLLVHHEFAEGPSFQEYGLGSGATVAVRDLVTMIKNQTGATTFLNFGAVPLRQNEVMESRADAAALRSLGWQPRIPLATGLAQTIELEKKLLERKAQ